MGVKEAADRINEYRTTSSKPDARYPYIDAYRWPSQHSISDDLTTLGEAKLAEMKDAGGKNQIEPQNPGWYLWYILDMGYFECGVVQVLKDTEEHLARLRMAPNLSFFIYENEAGETLTMYHSAAGGSMPHLPPMDAKRKPNVDLYIPFDMANLPIRVEKLVPRDLPE